MCMRGAVLYLQGMAPEIDGGECSIGAICVLRGGSGKAASQPSIHGSRTCQDRFDKGACVGQPLHCGIMRTWI